MPSVWRAISGVSVSQGRDVDPGADAERADRLARRAVAGGRAVVGLAVVEEGVGLGRRTLPEPVIWRRSSTRPPQPLSPEVLPGAKPRPMVRRRGRSARSSAARRRRAGRSLRGRATRGRRRAAAAARAVRLAAVKLASPAAGPSAPMSAPAASRPWRSRRSSRVTPPRRSARSKARPARRTRSRSVLVSSPPAKPVTLSLDCQSSPSVPVRFRERVRMKGTTRPARQVGLVRGDGQVVGRAAARQVGFAARDVALQLQPRAVEQRSGEEGQGQGERRLAVGERGALRRHREEPVDALVAAEEVVGAAAGRQRRRPVEPRAAVVGGGEAGVAVGGQEDGEIGGAEGCRRGLDQGFDRTAEGVAGEEHAALERAQAQRPVGDRPARRAARRPAAGRGEPPSTATRSTKPSMTCTRTVPSSTVCAGSTACDSR